MPFRSSACLGASLRFASYRQQIIASHPARAAVSPLRSAIFTPYLRSLPSASRTAFTNSITSLISFGSLLGKRFCLFPLHLPTHSAFQFFGSAASNLIKLRSFPPTHGYKVFVRGCFPKAHTHTPRASQAANRRPCLYASYLRCPLLSHSLLLRQRACPVLSERCRAAAAAACC